MRGLSFLISDFQITVCTYLLTKLGTNKLISNIWQIYPISYYKYKKKKLFCCLFVYIIINETSLSNHLCFNLANKKPTNQSSVNNFYSFFRLNPFCQCISNRRPYQEEIKQMNQKTGWVKMVCFKIIFHEVHLEVPLVQIYSWLINRYIT